MAHKEGFNGLKDIPEAVYSNDAEGPGVAAGVPAQEAENLCHRAADDEERLVAARRHSRSFAAALRINREETENE